jgi:hypothetical protein
LGWLLFTLIRLIWEVGVFDIDYFIKSPIRFWH